MSEPQTSVATVWAGRVVSAAVALFFFADAALGFFAPHRLDAELAATGFSPDLVRPVSVIALVCAILYAIPRTRVLGAILITGYLGGAICTHVRIGALGNPPQIVCLVLGALAWGGLYLGDPRVRALLPVAR